MYLLVLRSRNYEYYSSTHMHMAFELSRPPTLLARTCLLLSPCSHLLWPCPFSASVPSRCARCHSSSDCGSRCHRRHRARAYGCQLDHRCVYRHSYFITRRHCVGRWEAVADPLQFNAGKSDEANRGPGLDGRSCCLSWDGEPSELGRPRNEERLFQHIMLFRDFR